MPTMAFWRSMRTSAVLWESSLSSAMGLLRKRFVTKIEGTLDFQGIEYEDVLEFVKFDKGRPATGAFFTQARPFPRCGGGTVCRGWLWSNHDDRDGGGQAL